jgi:hypothetical protein
LVHRIDFESIAAWLDGESCGCGIAGFQYITLCPQLSFQQGSIKRADPMRVGLFFFVDIDAIWWELMRRDICPSDFCEDSSLPS